MQAANATLAVHARVAAWRFWPDVDFPRTHTLKVKRNQVRAWAAVAAPLPVTGRPTADAAPVGADQPGGTGTSEPTVGDGGGDVRRRGRSGDDAGDQG